MEPSPVSLRTRLRIPRPRARLESLSDDRLVELAREGDGAAFAAIYDRYAPSLLSFSAQILGSQSEGEDVVQIAMLAAHRELQSGRDLLLKPWLYTVVRNRSISVLRDRRARPLEQADEPTAPSMAGAVEQKAELRSILKDLARLPEEQRSALVLSELGDLSHAEIAGVLRCDPSRVKSLVFQARSGLMASRLGREADCTTIRVQLSTLTGGALRRREIREHLRVCEGCREFRDKVRSQRAQLALVLPLIPSPGLREAVLGAAGIGGGGTVVAAAGGGATVAAGGASLASGKVVAALVAGAVAAAGVGVAVTRDDSGAGRSGSGVTDSVKAPGSAEKDPVAADTGHDKQGRGQNEDGKRQKSHSSREDRKSRSADRSTDPATAVAEPAPAPAPVEAPAPPAEEAAGSGSKAQGSGSGSKASAPGQIRATEVSKGANGAGQSSAHSQSGGGGSNEIHATNAGGNGATSRSEQGAAHSNSGGGGNANSNAGGQASNGGGKPEGSPGGGKPEK